MITDKEIDHIARLARLNLNEKEKIKFQNELSLILDYVGKLKELDVENVEPTINASSSANIMRTDEIRQNSNKETVLKMLEQAPEKKDGFIKVKAIRSRAKFKV